MRDSAIAIETIAIEREASLIEVILFLERQPITVSTLAYVAKLDIETVERAIEELVRFYADTGRGLELVRGDDGVSLLPKRELWNILQQRYGTKNGNRLGRTTTETLAIIAYMQPVTRAEIESLRGVSVINGLHLLLDEGLIREVGTKQAPGRPHLYGTTSEFLKRFGLNSISDLPQPPQRVEEQFRYFGNGRSTER